MVHVIRRVRVCVRVCVCVFHIYKRQAGRRPLGAPGTQAGREASAVQVRSRRRVER